ncbi:hypothetical protein L6R53_22095 [Myxococcota bacterium]|nr:hypothetical protein [Myxococcota bacterium]
MRKLLPTLAVMLGFALACGEGDNGGTDAPVITVEQPATDKPAEAEKPAEPTEKKVTETISATVSVPAEQRATIENRGRQEIISKGKSMGYARVDNIKVGAENCSGSTCTATVTGTVTKTVKVEAGAEGEATGSGE